MSNRWTIMALMITAGALVCANGVEAQWSRADEGRCQETWGSRDRDRYCYALEGEFADPSELRVDGGLNGGISVEGWNRDVVSVRARIWATAATVERARELADGVRAELDGGRLTADGPSTNRRESWGVSWEVRVPRETDLDMETHNGGIEVVGVTGRIRFDALNGGVDLRGVGGDVVGRTTNGGIDVELDGSRWSGEGLDVETTNGGVTVLVPEAYSARLETGTVNGGIDVDFPITVEGRIGRRIATTLGEGGPTVRAYTTNGGVEIRRGSRAIR